MGKSPQVKRAYVVYACYPDSIWFWKGSTWAVSPAQAVNYVFHRIHGRKLREDVGQTFRALELGSAEELTLRVRASSVPHEYALVAPARELAQSLLDFGGQHI